MVPCLPSAPASCADFVPCLCFCDGKGKGKQNRVGLPPEILREGGKKVISVLVFCSLLTSLPTYLG